MRTLKMTTPFQRLAAEDLLEMSDDGIRYELIAGELRETSPSGRRHGKIAMRLSWRLAQYVETHNLGEVNAAETGFLIASNPDTVRAPDVAFVSRKKAEALGDIEGYCPVSPDLAVEVISPNDTGPEIEAKALAWLHAGTRMVFVVDPHAHTVTVYRRRDDIVVLEGDAALHGGDVVPGWTVGLREIFAE